MSSRDTEILQLLDELEKVPPEDISVIGDLIFEYATSAKRLGQLIDHFAESSAAHIINPLVFAVCHYQSKHGYRRPLLKLWVKLIPAILRTWRERPETAATALNGIDGEFRAINRRKLPSNVDFSMVAALIYDCLQPYEVPRLRDSIFAQSVDFLSLLITLKRLNAVFPRSERSKLAGHVRLARGWFEGRHPWSPEEIRHADRVLVKLER